MNYYQKYLVDEFAEDYSEGLISRRQALKLIASIIGGAAASAILAACTPPPQQTATSAPTLPQATMPPAAPTSAPSATRPPATPTIAASVTATTGGTTSTPSGAVTVSPDDPAITAGDLQFPGDGATLQGYLARPKGDGPFRVVLVCHENRGLTDHIKDVARRLGKAGFLGMAVDLLSRQGGTAKQSADSVPGLLSSMDPALYTKDFASAIAYLKTQKFADATKTGMVGFCYGGGVTWQIAANIPELLAAVPFYGPPVPVESVPKIKAAVLAIYAENDSRITGTRPQMEAAMKANNKVFEAVVYPGADHAFHNDTGTRYNAQAARDAWMRTLAWFEKYLK